MGKEHVGRIARIMITNHHKNRLTHKAELCTALSIGKKQLEVLMEKVVQFLEDFGLEMEGVEKHESGQADKFFLRLAISEDVKRTKPEVSEDERRLFFIFSVVQIENNNLSGAKIEEIESCQYFADVGVEAYLKKLKNSGYLACRKVGEDMIWSYGWRFYIEYGDSFDVVGYFKSWSRSAQTGLDDENN